MAFENPSGLQIELISPRCVLTMGWHAITAGLEWRSVPPAWVGTSSGVASPEGMDTSGLPMEGALSNCRDAGLAEAGRAASMLTARSGILMATACAGLLGTAAGCSMDQTDMGPCTGTTPDAPHASLDTRDPHR